MSSRVAAKEFCGGPQKIAQATGAQGLNKPHSWRRKLFRRYAADVIQVFLTTQGSCPGLQFFSPRPAGLIIELHRIKFYAQFLLPLLDSVSDAGIVRFEHTCVSTTSGEASEEPSLRISRPELDRGFHHDQSQIADGIPGMVCLYR